MDDKNINGIPEEPILPDDAGAEAEYIPEEEPKPKRDWKTTILGAKGSKRGMYTALTSVIVIAIVIILNLFIGQLPTSATELDITGSNLYTVSSASQEFLAGLNDDIEIVVLAQDGTVDERIMKFIYNYAAKSSHITVTEVDPILHPSALDTYGAEANTVVVINKATAKQTSIKLTGFDGMDSAMILYDSQTYYYYNQMKAVSFDADGQLTSAINIVTGDSAGTVYTLTNHGETALPTNITDRIAKLNLTSSELDLLMAGSIPEDCDLLVCNNPTTDMTEEELNLVANYLRDGGDVLLVVDTPDLTNFNALLAKYGLQLQQGYVGDEERYYQTYAQSFGYYCIAPQLSTASSVTSGISANALLLYPRGMLEITPERRGSTVEAFMTTSNSAYAYVDENNMSDKQQFILGAVCTESFDTNSDGTEDYASHLTVISSAQMINEELTGSMASISNVDIFINALSGNLEKVSAVSVPVKSMSLTYNTLTSTGIWSVLFIAVIPAALIIGGLVYWSRRRKR